MHLPLTVSSFLPSISFHAPSFLFTEALTTSFHHLFFWYFLPHFQSHIFFLHYKLFPTHSFRYPITHNQYMLPFYSKFCPNHSRISCFLHHRLQNGNFSLTHSILMLTHPNSTLMLYHISLSKTAFHFLVLSQRYHLPHSM